VKSDYLWLLAQLERELPVDRELVDWARSVMLDGLDSPSLVLLAGLTPCEHDDAKKLFLSSLAELGFHVPGRRRLMLHMAGRLGIDLVEIPEREEVVVNGVSMEGHITDQHCSDCSSLIVYHEHHDSEFCPVCNTWLGSVCADPDCEFCNRRPDTPLDGSGHPTG